MNNIEINERKICTLTNFAKFCNKYDGRNIFRLFKITIFHEFLNIISVNESSNHMNSYLLINV